MHNRDAVISALHYLAAQEPDATHDEIREGAVIQAAARAGWTHPDGGAAPLYPGPVEALPGKVPHPVTGEAVDRRPLKPTDELPSGWEWVWHDDVVPFGVAGPARWMVACHERQLVADGAASAWRQAAITVEGDDLIDEDPMPPNALVLNGRTPADHCQWPFSAFQPQTMRNRDAWIAFHGSGKTW